MFFEIYQIIPATEFEAVYATQDKKKKIEVQTRPLICFAFRGLNITSEDLDEDNVDQIVGMVSYYTDIVFADMLKNFVGYKKKDEDIDYDSIKLYLEQINKDTKDRKKKSELKEKMKLIDLGEIRNGKKERTTR